ncbi:MAG: phosphodiester glycosidase family protein [Candidatus Gastranaerophilaceae bacterium]|jgi:exopolysaccharide biosynthesis protein
MKYKNLIFLPIILLIIVFCSQISASEYSFFIFKNSIYVLKISDVQKYNIQPYISEKLETVSEIAKKTNAFAVINGGFFDPKNMKTISYVVKDGQIIADPALNENLTESKALQSHLNKIYNRSELRINDCFGRTKFDIARHNLCGPLGCYVVHSIQAGPQLLPYMDLEDEFFVLKQNGKIVRNSAGVLNKTARAAIGIKGNELYLIVTKEESKMNIYEFQTLLKKLNLDKAMAFDGGSSVSLYLNDCGKQTLVKGMSDGGLRKIKSALVLTSAK